MPKRVEFPFDERSIESLDKIQRQGRVPGAKVSPCFPTHGTAAHIFPSDCPKAVLDSDDLATCIWEHLKSVDFGNGKQLLAQMDIQAIIDEWLTDRRGHQFEWQRLDYPAEGRHVCKFCGMVAPVEARS